MAEGGGQVRINFVSFDELCKLKGIASRIARQICDTRNLMKNKLTLEDWQRYRIWDPKRKLTHHFDFTPNPSNEKIEDDDFQYYIPSRKEIKPEYETKTYDSKTDESNSEDENVVMDKKSTKPKNVRSKNSFRPDLSDIPKSITYNGTGDYYKERQVSCLNIYVHMTKSKT